MTKRSVSRPLDRKLLVNHMCYIYTKVSFNRCCTIHIIKNVEFNDQLPLKNDKHVLSQVVNICHSW